MRHSFTKLVGAAVIMLGLAGAAQAQTEPTDIIRPLTKAGSAAFLFTLGGFGTFNIGPPPIGTVTNPNTTPVLVQGAGMKYFLSDDLALRVLLGFGTSSSGADTLPTGKVTGLNFGIAAAIEYHFRPLYSTSPYVGGGINFATGSITTTRKGLSDGKVSGSLFGVGVFAGFDWFFTRGLAIGAEYGLNFTSNSASTTIPNGTGSTVVDSPSTTAIALGLNGAASVHAVVYF